MISKKIFFLVTMISIIGLVFIPTAVQSSPIWGGGSTTTYSTFQQTYDFPSNYGGGSNSISFTYYYNYATGSTSGDSFTINYDSATAPSGYTVSVNHLPVYNTGTGYSSITWVNYTIWGNTQSNHMDYSVALHFDSTSGSYYPVVSLYVIYFQNNVLIPGAYST